MKPEKTVDTRKALIIVAITALTIILAVFIIGRISKANRMKEMPVKIGYTEDETFDNLHERGYKTVNLGESPYRGKWWIIKTDWFNNGYNEEAQIYFDSSTGRVNEIVFIFDSESVARVFFEEMETRYGKANVSFDQIKGNEDIEAHWSGDGASITMHYFVGNFDKCYFLTFE